MKIVEKSNYRIVVEPITHIFGISLGVETIQRDLMEMQSEIKRHVDNVDRVYIDFDTLETCSHCGLRWELSEDDEDPDFPKGCPVCCHEAADEWKLENKKA